MTQLKAHTTESPGKVIYTAKKPTPREAERMASRAALTADSM